MKNQSLSLFAVLGIISSALPSYAGPGNDTSPPYVSQIRTFKEKGGRVDWSPDGTQVAFDRIGADGYTDIFVTAVDGSGERCLTCDLGKTMALHNGNPAWHPSGRYLVFQSQDPRYPGLPLIGKLVTSPGSGINNDLALMTSDGSRHWRLNSVGKGGGVLHPQFSHDGKRLIWAERLQSASPTLGQWTIKLADFSIEGSEPLLKNIQDLRPGNLQMYETHGFSPDDSRILFTGCSDADFFKSEIYLYDLASRRLARLTDPALNAWDEHAHFLADGSHIIWMSSTDIPQNKKRIAPFTDYWIMKPDGSQKKRLTFFNADKTNPFFQRTAADFSPDPTHPSRFLGYLINITGKDYHRDGPGPIVWIDLVLN